MFLCIHIIILLLDKASCPKCHFTLHHSLKRGKLWTSISEIGCIIKIMSNQYYEDEREPHWMLAAGRTGTACHLHGSAEVSTLGNVVSVSAAYWRLTALLCCCKWTSLDIWSFRRIQTSLSGTQQPHQSLSQPFFSLCEFDINGFCELWWYHIIGWLDKVATERICDEPELA